jgi:hypothetical protein
MGTDIFGPIRHGFFTAGRFAARLYAGVSASCNKATYGHVQAEMRRPARDAMERLFLVALFSDTGADSGADTKNRLCASHTKPEFKGQVGQESNLHPAVVEPAAVRSATFRDVHEQP